MAQRIFDPIGFTCSVTLLPKLLVQELWKLKLGWDKEFPENILHKFRACLKQITWLSFCTIPRSLTNFSYTSSNTLHVFCDVSKLAYATCIFLRAEISYRYRCVCVCVLL